MEKEILIQIQVQHEFQLAGITPQSFWRMSPWKPSLLGLCHSPPLFPPLLWLTCCEGEELEQKNRSSSSRERVRNNELNSKACIDIPSCDHAKVTGREANSEEQLDFPATSEGLRGLSPPKPHRKFLYMLLARGSKNILFCSALSRRKGRNSWGVS